MPAASILAHGGPWGILPALAEIPLTGVATTLTGGARTTAGGTIPFFLPNDLLVAITTPAGGTTATAR